MPDRAKMTAKELLHRYAAGERAFGGADLRNAKLRGALLRDVGLFDADLRKCDFREADLRKACLIESTLVEANLSDANLRGADLREASLIRARLDRADLTNAKLNVAHLGGTQLPGARLVRAQLAGGRFQQTNLEGANLSAVDLINAELDEACILNANLDGAVLGGTIFHAIDLSRTPSIESAIHISRSPITIDTLIQTASGLATAPQNRGVVEAFFRSAGVEENVLDFFSTLVHKPIEFYSVFISYSHADKSFARRLHDQLQARGIRCWLDEHQLLPGDNIYDHVDRGIRLWDKLLLCCSRSALASWWVDKELGTAFEKEERLQKERNTKVHSVIPLNLDNYLFEWEDGKASKLRERMAPSFIGWEQDNTIFEREFAKLVKALRIDGRAREKPPKTRL